MAQTPQEITARIVDDGDRWPDLHWLTTVAGCDCQMMALAMTDKANIMQGSTSDAKAAEQ